MTVRSRGHHDSRRRARCRPAAARRERTRRRSTRHAQPRLGLLRARSFNIESLTVGATHEPGRSRMTIAIRGDDGHLRQVLAQLERVIDVLEVEDLDAVPHVELELALVELDAPADARPSMPCASRSPRPAANAHDRCVRLAGAPDHLPHRPRSSHRDPPRPRPAPLSRAGSVAMTTPNHPATELPRHDQAHLRSGHRSARCPASASRSSAKQQGEAHARNLSESGLDVVVGLRPDSGSAERAREAGLRVTDAHRQPPRSRGDGARARTRPRRRSTTPRSSPTCATGRC